MSLSATKVPAHSTALTPARSAGPSQTSQSSHNVTGKYGSAPYHDYVVLSTCRAGARVRLYVSEIIGGTLGFAAAALCGFLLAFRNRNTFRRFVEYICAAASRLYGHFQFQPQFTRGLNTTSVAARVTTKLLSLLWPMGEDRISPDNVPHSQTPGQQTVFGHIELPEAFRGGRRGLATASNVLAMTRPMAEQASNTDNVGQDRELEELEAELVGLRLNGLACADAPPAYV